MIRCLTSLILLPAGLSGCSPSPTAGGFDSPNPAARLYAIEDSVQSGDTSSVREIVRELRSVDPAARLMAIEALRRLTGETMGYRHDDPVAEREAAIDRWEQAVADNPAWRPSDA
ncbi:MAG: hypothetical protein AAF432_09375 [Planctomycetota bacterium]